jgi:FtsP/CotA-like multicopper oxidase with cupredoxin domain
MHDHSSHGQTDIVEFPSATEGLPEAHRPEVVELSDGDEFDLEIAPVRKQIGDASVRMLAYNGSVPGPTLKVPQDATITVHVTNRGDIDATVHWHGLRLENRYDGTHETQAPIPVGETFTYEVTVPDPGAYWYHPHIREDYGQEMGLYGNILAVPIEEDHWPPASGTQCLSPVTLSSRSRPSAARSFASTSRTRPTRASSTSRFRARG